MAQQGFDMSKLSTGEKVVAGAGALYFIWSFIAVWYKVDLGPLGELVSEVIPGQNISGFRGFTLFASLLALLAVVEIVVRMFGVNIEIPRGTVHLAAAGIAALFTLLGLFVKPAGYGISWGIFVAIVLALAWLYGAYMLYSQPAGAASAPPSTGGDAGGIG